MGKSGSKTLSFQERELEDESLLQRHNGGTGKNLKKIVPRPILSVHPVGKFAERPPFSVSPLPLGSAPDAPSSPPQRMMKPLVTQDFGGREEYEEKEGSSPFPCATPPLRKGFLLVYLHRVKGVPLVDFSSLCNCGGTQNACSIRGSATHKRSQLLSVVDWIFKRHSRNGQAPLGSGPAWFETRPLGISLEAARSSPLSSRMYLIVELWDKQKNSDCRGNGELIIARASVSLTELIDQTKGGAVSLPLPLVSNPKLMNSSQGYGIPFPVPCVFSSCCEIASSDAPAPPLLTLQLLNSRQLPRQKNIFLIRHGESEWNRAQARLDVEAMYRQTDHPLTEKGREQAEHLRGNLAQRLHFPEDFATFSDEKKKLFLEEREKIIRLVSPDNVLVSPLTRAVQTAVIALQDVFGSSVSPSVIVCPNMKEKQSFFGKDSKGSEVGQNILAKAETCLKQLYGENDEPLRQLKRINWDLEEVSDRWWSNSSEKKAETEARLDAFMGQIAFSPSNHVVAVGHSHFFREIMRKFLSEEFKLENPKFSAELSQKCLENCGVLKIEIQLPPSLFSSHNSLLNLDRCVLITKAELLLGSTLVSTSHGKNIERLKENFRVFRGGEVESEECPESPSSFQS